MIINYSFYFDLGNNFFFIKVMLRNQTFFYLYDFLWIVFWFTLSFYCVLLFIIILYHLLMGGCGGGVGFVGGVGYLYIFNGVDNLLPNLQLYWCGGWANYLNPLLTNSINKWHPFYFYYGTGLMVGGIGSLYWCAFYAYEYQFNYLYYYYLIYSNYIVLFLYISLGAGAWWAAQEGSWGGWWNWDPSEVLGLLFLLGLLYFFHYWPLRIMGWCVVGWASEVLLLLVIMFLFVQLNFNLVIHNFGLRHFYFFTSNLIFGELLSVVGVCWVGWVVGGYSQFHQYLLYWGVVGRQCYQLLYSYWLGLNMYIIVLISKAFAGLVGYFIWDLFILLVVLFNGNWICYSIFFYLMLVVMVAENRSNYLVGCYVGSVGYLQILFLHLMWWGRMYIYKLHWFVVVYYGVILWTYNLDVVGVIRISLLGGELVGVWVFYILESAQHVLDNVFCSGGRVLFGGGYVDWTYKKTPVVLYVGGVEVNLFFLPHLILNIIYLNMFQPLQFIYFSGVGLNYLLIVGALWLGFFYFYCGRWGVVK